MRQTKTILALLCVCWAACGDDDAQPTDAAQDSEADGELPRVPGPTGWREVNTSAFNGGGQPYLIELASGEVQRMLGDDSFDSLDISIERYSPATKAWTRVADFEMRAGIPTASSGISLSDGRLLLAGGCRFSLTARVPAELSWPNAYLVALDGSITEVTSMMTSRAFHAGAELSDGQVLITGGATIAVRDGPYTALPSTEIYSVTSDVWTPGPEMSVARFQHRVVRLSGGDLLIIGGRDEDGVHHASVERYEAASGQLMPVASMDTARAAFVATTLPSGRVLVAGGHTGAMTTTSSVEIYDPAANRWETGPPLPVATAFSGVVSLPNGAPLVVGGYEAFPVPVGMAVVFDEAANGWAAMDDLGEARFDPGVIALSSREVLVVGGLQAMTGIAIRVNSSEESDGAFDL